VAGVDAGIGHDCLDRQQAGRDDAVRAGPVAFSDMTERPGFATACLPPGEDGYFRWCFLARG